MAEFLADRMGESNVGDDAAAEEGVFVRFFGFIDELIDQDDVAGLVFRLEGPDSADADDPADVETFQSPDVGAVIQFRW